MTAAARRPSRFVRWAASRFGVEPRHIEIWERLILTSFLVTAAVYLGRFLHLMEGIEIRWLDLLADIDRPQFAVPVVVVAITDEDYRDPTLFGGMSPLHPKGIARILDRVLAAQPRGVVLDIQIHPEPNEPLDRARGRLQLYRTIDSASRAGSPPMVLVRSPEDETAFGGEHDSVQAEWGRLTSNPRLVWSDPTITRADGFVRSIPRYHTAAIGHLVGRPTILGAAIEAFHLVPHRSVPWWAIEEEHPTAPWRIRFTGELLEDLTTITPHRTNALAAVSGPDAAGHRSLLADRLVLIGGTYRQSRDLQPTPIGPMAGVYVWAEAIGSWIRHDALREPLAPIGFALEFLVGVISGLLLVRAGPALGLIWSLVIVGPLMVVFSLLTFGDRYLFVNFLPSFAGVYLHYQVELHHELGHLKARLHEALASKPDLLSPVPRHTSSPTGMEPVEAAPIATLVPETGSAEVVSPSDERPPTPQDG